MSQNREKYVLSFIALDGQGHQAKFKQIEEQIRAAILSGRLQPGEKLPSTRQLAKDLGVSRNTIKNAFHQLAAEGYVSAAVGTGTRIAQELPESMLQIVEQNAPNVQLKSDLPNTKFGERVSGFASWVKAAANRPTKPFLPHTPALDMFPRDVWTRLTSKRMRQLSASYLDRGDPQGFAPLRSAIANYLSASRGFNCAPGQVVVTAGAQQGLELIAKLLVNPGDIVCMEDPCYTPAKLLFELAGAQVISVPVNEGGISTEFLKRTVPKAKLVYVTPSSQFPLTMTMPLARRLELIEWARNSGAVVLEDDYNGEYRYSGSPVPALYGIVPKDVPAIYIGSFSKLMFPSLRSGYLVVPHQKVEVFSTARWLADRHSPILEQAVLSDFIEEGHFARHVRRMRTLYAKRQAACIAAVQSELGDVLAVRRSDVGLHLLGWLQPGVSEQDVLAAAENAQIELSSTSIFYAAEPKVKSVLLGYAPYSEKLIWRAATALRDAYHQLKSRR